MATFALVLAGVWLAGAPAVRAHPLAPAVLDLRELDGGRVDVNWKIPLPAARGATARPVLPEWCADASEPLLQVEASSIRRRWSADCGERGLTGGIVRIADLETTGADAFIRITRRNGVLIQSIVSARDPSLPVPPQASRADVLWTYGLLGGRHILGGPDHLLFVFGLLLLAGSARRVLQTVTAFTVGHSITLSLAVFGFAPVPTGPAELAIALSVFALAVDLERSGEQRHNTLLGRAPWAMAFAFGLLHGLGFASALRESGLPADAVPLSLFAFNSGIEIGQIAFVLCVLAAWRALARMPVQLPRWTYRVPIYAMGSLAAFWCFERGAALLR